MASCCPDLPSWCGSRRRAGANQDRGVHRRVGPHGFRTSATVTPRRSEPSSFTVAQSQVLQVLQSVLRAPVWCCRSAPHAPLAQMPAAQKTAVTSTLSKSQQGPRLVEGSPKAYAAAESKFSSSYTSRDNVKQVKRNQMHNVMKTVVQHDREIRELEAWSCNTFLLGKDKPAKDLMSAMAAWKAKIPESGTLPKRQPRWTVAGTVANMLVTDPNHRARLGKFVAHHEDLQSVEDTEDSVQLAVAKETRDGQVLLRIRPTGAHR